MAKYRSKGREEPRGNRGSNRPERIIEPQYVVEDTPKKVAPLRALNETQYNYINHIRTKDITFAIGSAGSGKTYIAAAIAAELLQNKDISKIIIVRPKVTAGEDFGHLPGELEDKFFPYIEPFVDVLKERLGGSFVDYLVKSKRIVFKPLAYMRGTTLKDCMVVLDEAQNTTPEQMYLFLTRLGHNCTAIIDGDLKQKDIRGYSGLEDAIKKIQHLPQVGLVEFDDDECVRSGTARDILFAYR